MQINFPAFTKNFSQTENFIPQPYGRVLILRTPEARYEVYSYEEKFFYVQYPSSSTPDILPSITGTYLPSCDTVRQLLRGDESREAKALLSKLIADKGVEDSQAVRERAEKVSATKVELVQLAAPQRKTEGGNVLASEQAIIVYAAKLFFKRSVLEESSETGQRFSRQTTANEVAL
jgi:hypothetical protein